MDPASLREWEADGRRERETELQGHGTENEEKEMIQRGGFRKTA